MIRTDSLHVDDWEEYFSDLTSSEEDGYYITEFIIPEEERGKGKGTEELLQFLNQVKNDKKYVFLQAYPHEITDCYQFTIFQKRLIKWYEKFGFVHVGQGWMFLKP